MNGVVDFQTKANAKLDEEILRNDARREKLALCEERLRDLDAEIVLLQEERSLLLARIRVLTDG